MDWRKIPDWPYEVSEYGDVRNIKTNKIRSPGNYNGYRYYDLWKNNKSVKFWAHRLVAFAFIGNPPSENHEVAHWDGDPSNNHYSNLRWATHKENHDDSVRHGTQKDAPITYGEKHGYSKLKEEDVREIKTNCRLGAYQQINRYAEKFGVTKATVRSILKEESWKWLKI